VARGECSVEWCREDASSKGLCAEHFTASWRNPRSLARPPKAQPKPQPKPKAQTKPQPKPKAQPKPQPKPKKPGPPKAHTPRLCCIEGCGGVHSAQGLCKRHYSARRYDAKRIDRSTRPTLKTRILEKAERVSAIKVAAGCVDCGYKDHAVALDFDHLPGCDKVANISKLVKNDTDWDTIAEEIAKCVVVCARCHRVRTHERRTVNRMKELRKVRAVPQTEGRVPKVCAGCNKVFRDLSTNNNKKWCTDNCRRATAYRLRLWPSQWKGRE
jgi:hypothetical protein